MFAAVDKKKNTVTCHEIWTQVHDVQFTHTGTREKKRTNKPVHIMCDQSKQLRRIRAH